MIFVLKIFYYYLFYLFYLHYICAKNNRHVRNESPTNLTTLKFASFLMLQIEGGGWLCLFDSDGHNLEPVVIGLFANNLRCCFFYSYVARYQEAAATAVSRLSEPSVRAKSIAVGAATAVSHAKSIAVGSRVHVKKGVTPSLGWGIISSQFFYGSKFSS